MKKLKKYILLIMALNVCFFAYESEKREAEAFAMSTAALVLGGMAIVGVGGAILSRGNAETLGQNIINNIESAGQKVEDFFSYNAVTEIGKVTMGAVLKTYFNNAIGSMKANVVSTDDTFKLESSSYTTLNRTYQTKIKFKLGDTIRFTASYTNTSSKDYVMTIGAGTWSNNVAKDSAIVLESGSHSINKTITVSNTQYDTTLKLIIGTPTTTDGELTINSIKIDNLTTQGTDEYKNQAQYAPISSVFSERAATLDSNLTKPVYEVSPNNIVDNVSSVEQIEQTLPPVEDTTSGTNTLIQRMIIALANIPTAIKAEMSDLWADAGAIWSGMNDTLINIKTDVGAKIGAMSDTMAGGIDNIRTDIGAMMENLRSGIDSLATSAAANMAAWGQLTLEGIDAGVGTITNGLTSIWERVGAIPGAIAAIPGDIVTSLTDLAVPTAAQTAENEENMKTTKQLFLSKFEFITVPIEQIKSLYAQRKSLHDLTVEIMGQTVYVLPIQFAGVVSGFRPIASGAAVVGTIIFIYRRIQPEDVI